MEIKNIIRRFIPKFLFDRYKEWETKQEYRRWLDAGKPIPPATAVKRLAIREYQKKSGYAVLVETGTYKGDMVYTQMNYFREIYSIELAEYYYTRAVKRFKKYPQVHLFHGDSAKILKTVLNKIKEPVVFWLDGHYSGGMTAKGEEECPIWGELDAIFPISYPHVLMIDDARCFTGKDGYPTLDELKSYLNKQSVSYTFAVENDIVRVCLEK